MTPDEFRIIRNQLSLTQTQLAPLLGYADKSRISELETGRRDIPWHIAQLMRCYAVLGCEGIPQELEEGKT